MSHHSLPDDHSCWPSDPFELLGVDRSASDVELRRAYVRLIKRYKPEQFPEEFQKLRAAYEHALQWCEWRGEWDEQDAPEEIEEVDTAPNGNEYLTHEPRIDPNSEREEFHSSLSASSADRTEEQEEYGLGTSHEPLFNAQKSRGSESRKNRKPPIDHAWSLAVQGQPAQALDELLRLRDQQPQNPEPPLRLYWLLKLCPELRTPQLQPFDVLVSALKATSLSYRLCDAYERELENDPRLVTREVNKGVLTVNADSWQLTMLARIRCDAAAKIGDGGIIAKDLAELRDRLSFDEPMLWLQVIMHVHQRAIWGGGPISAEICRLCLREVELYPELHLKLADSLDRMTQRTEMQECFSRTPAHEALFVFLKSLDGNSYETSQQHLWELAVGWLADPREALKLLDSFQHENPIGFYLLWQRVMQLPNYHSIPEDDPPRVKARIRQFLFEKLGSPYLKWRTDLIRFCLMEWTPVVDVAELLENEWNLSPGELARSIRDDGPSHCIVSAGIAVFDSGSRPAVFHPLSE